MDEFQQALVDSINRLAAATEGISLGAKTTKKKSSAKPAESKPGDQSTRGLISRFEGPNKYGFIEIVIDGVKYSTKRTSLGESLQQAFDAESIVEITFNETTKEGTQGRVFTNRYIQTVDVIAGGSNISETPAEVEEEAPF